MSPSIPSLSSPGDQLSSTRNLIIVFVVLWIVSVVLIKNNPIVQFGTTLVVIFRQCVSSFDIYIIYLISVVNMLLENRDTAR